MAVLGPDSINDSKFSAWSTEQYAHGIIWNTLDRTVSMPSDKIQKDLDRVSELLVSEKASKQQLQKLLGSLRHITMCLRAAKPFFQQLQVACNRQRPFQLTRLSSSMHRDLQWFHHILSDGHLEEMPLRFLGDLPAPTINLYMDASNSGLAVLHPARDEFIQLRFDTEELSLIQDAATTGFSINISAWLLLPGAGGCNSCKTSVTPTSSVGVTTFPRCRGSTGFTPKTPLVKKLIVRLDLPKLSTRLVCPPDISRGNQPHGRCGFKSIYKSIVTLVICAVFVLATGTSARALKETLQDILRELHSNSLVKSSRKRYESSWKQWCRWCNDMKYSPWLPNDSAIASRQIVLFAVYCHRYGRGSTTVRGNSLQTIQSKISAVVWYHRLELGFNIWLLLHHAMAIKGIHRLQPSPLPKQPITLSTLRSLHRSLNFKSAHDRVLWGATIMGFFFLLRRSEYLCDGM